MRSGKRLMDFRHSGKRPTPSIPSSPLITLLETLTPRDRQEIKGVRITTLGYNNGMVWANAEQLYRWIKPSSRVFGSYPADGYMDRRFNKKLVVNDLLDSSTKYPDQLRGPEA
jgi:hypothetical protein